jgi:cation diffusion facilitator family transporter
MSRFHSGIRAIHVGIATNALLSTVKLIAGILGNSYALIADAVESMADILTSAVAWGGLAVSRIPADADHPYGHGKAEPLSAAVISLMILAAAAGIAIQAVREILAPHRIPRPFTLIVLFVVVVVKEVLARYLRKVGREIDSNALRGDAWNQRSDALTSLLAALGIATALIGGPGFQSGDDWAALLAAGVIAAGGIRFLIPAIHELMDRQPEGDLRERAVEVARAQDRVRAVEKNWLRKVGSRYFFDLHLEVDPQLTVRDSHHIAHRVSEAVRAAYPEIEAVTVHIEPHGGAAGGS